ncbi:MBL fold metallo-hydrolase [Fusibacter sp. JL216-2]|uniref:MBL fold metallo-hydrolase n=1 Tax=Fusibacter sp. JL216-2 TaxID=3071453 RepID=UPI003D33C41E
MRVHFLGATGEVTGSNFLIETNNSKFLIDCGLFQGPEPILALNSEDFAYDPSEIDFVILTHAHIDHSGRLPLLVKRGFHNRIYCTRPTSDLADVLLKDSGKINEAETAWENKKRERAGLDKIEPLFTMDDAVISLQYLNPVDYNEEIQVAPGIKFIYREAGHLLGSASIELFITEDGQTKHLIFSGDLGTGKNQLLPNPAVLKEADYVFMESTYGGRQHKDMDLRGERVAAAISEAVSHGGTVIIPAFAVGRTQEILYELKNYMKTHEKGQDIFDIPYYIDSPLAIDATEIFKKNFEYFKEPVKNVFVGGGNPIKFKNLHIIKEMDTSMGLNKDQTPKVIISASGMCDAGRIRHHLKHNLWKENTAIIFVGYQGEGTLGRKILDGAQTVEILDETIKVASRIIRVEGFSGHADESQLLHWLSSIKGVKRVFLNHGEALAVDALSLSIREKLGLSVHAPEAGEVIEI